MISTIFSFINELWDEGSRPSSDQVDILESGLSISSTLSIRLLLKRLSVLLGIFGLGFGTKVRFELKMSHCEFLNRTIVKNSGYINYRAGP